MTFRSIVITEDFHGTNDLNARGIGRNDDDTLLLVLVRVVGVTLSKHKMQSATRVAGTADPPVRDSLVMVSRTKRYAVPFVTVNNNLVALLSDGSANVGGIG